MLPAVGANFWVAALASAVAMAIIGAAWSGYYCGA